MGERIVGWRIAPILESSSFSPRSARRSRGLQDTPSDLSRKRGNTGFYFTMHGEDFRRNAFLGGADAGGGFHSDFFELESAFVEQFLARGFLCGVNLRAGLFQRVLVLLDLFYCGKLG